MPLKQVLRFSLPVIFFSLSAVPPPAKAQSNTVKLDVVVRDSANNPVTGLRQQDFQVTDNGSAQSLTSFAEISKDDTPATVVLVFDLINNSQTYSTLLRDQLLKYLRANGGRLQQPTLLTVVTPTGVSSLPSPTTNGEALANVLARVPVGPDVNQRLTGGAGGLQRFNFSIKALNETLGTAGRLPGRKLVIWMSQGWALMGGMDLTPGQEQEIFTNIKQYSTGMRLSRVTLYSVNTYGASASVSSLQAYRQYLKGVNAVNKTDFADMGLQVLATQSGGLVINSNDLAAMLDSCLKDAGPHYEIEFPAGVAAKNLAFHEVKVTVNRPNVTARTRNGYYPQ